jgi:hypothetical protein
MNNLIQFCLNSFFLKKPTSVTDSHATGMVGHMQHLQNHRSRHNSQATLTFLDYLLGTKSPHLFSKYFSTQTILMSQQLPTTRKKHHCGNRGTKCWIKPWRAQTCPAAFNFFTLLQVPVSRSKALEPPAIPTFASEHLSLSNFPELTTPSTKVCVNVQEHFPPSTKMNFVSEHSAPPAGVSEPFATSTGVSELFPPPTPSLPSSVDNLAMLTKRDAIIHLALSRAHSIYAKTLTDDQMPQLVKQEEVHSSSHKRPCPAWAILDPCSRW